MSIKDEALKEAIRTIEDLCDAFMLGPDWQDTKFYDAIIVTLENCRKALKEKNHGTT